MLGLTQHSHTERGNEVIPRNFRMKRLLALPILLAALGALIPSSPGRATEPAVIRIGMVQSLFHDVPTPLVNLLTPPFRGLMRDFTGLNGEIVTGGDSFDMARRLADDKIQLVVFHGLEFGWAQQKHSELRPLMLAVHKHPIQKAHLVVRNDSTIADFADLKGKDLAIHFRSKEHCRVFIEKNCGVSGKCDPKSFFGNITKPAHSEAALDDVLTGKVSAAVVDTVSLESYEEVKPGCHARLKLLKLSESFPAATIAYREGSLSSGTLAKFRDGMISANRSERGRELMDLWKISSFQPIPGDFQQSLAAIVQAYPAPFVATAVSAPVSR